MLSMRHPIQSSHLQTGCGCTRLYLGIARGPKPNWSSRPLAILRKSICVLLSCYVQRNVARDLVRYLLVEGKFAAEVIKAF